jgi:hypothetical protein
MGSPLICSLFGNSSTLKYFWQLNKWCFDAMHKKSLDLISEGRKIGFVALHNSLFGLKRSLAVSHRR